MSTNPSIKSTESNGTKDSSGTAVGVCKSISGVVRNPDSVSFTAVSVNNSIGRQNSDVVPSDRPPSYISRSNTPSMDPRHDETTSAESGIIVTQPPGMTSGNVWGHNNPQASTAPGFFDMEFLLDVGQVVMHKANLRLNQVFNPSAIQRTEIIDETRRILLHVEQDPPEEIQESFMFRLYNRRGKEVIHVLNPRSNLCICAGASWHWFKRCRFQAVVYSPPGVVAGFVRREHTFFVQEYHILNQKEEIVLVLRGGPMDLEVLSPDFENELGRLSVHNWIGIMHEVRRSANDVGLTFPMDLDCSFKSVLIGALVAIDWIISCEGGKKLPPPPSTRELKPSIQSNDEEAPLTNNIHDNESNIDSVQLTCSLDNESAREDARSRFSADQRDLLTAEDYMSSSIRANAGSRADIDNRSVDFTIDSAVCVGEGSIAENMSIKSEKKPPSD